MQQSCRRARTKIVDGQKLVKCLNDYKCNTGRTLSTMSLTNYLRHLKLVNIEYEDDLCKLHDLDYLEEKIKAIPNINSRINVLFGVSFFIKHMSVGESAMNAYHNLLARFQDTIKNRKKLILENFWNDERYKNLCIVDLRNKFNSKLEHVLSKQGKKEIEDKYGAAYLYVLQQYFIVSLYLFQEAQRNDYNELKYIKSIDYNLLSANGIEDDNYLVDKGITFDIVINNFKTKKVYKQIRFSLGNISSKIFIAMRNYREEIGKPFIRNQQVFQKRNQHKSLLRHTQHSISAGDQLCSWYDFSRNTNRFVMMSSRAIFGIELGCNAYRHLAVINILQKPEYNSLSQRQKEEIANKMGHSFLTQQIYNRVENNDIDIDEFIRT